MEDANFRAWMAGRYVADAISACFSRGKHKYPTEPYQTENKSSESDDHADVKNFKAFAMMYNKTHVEQYYRSEE